MNDSVLAAAVTSLVVSLVLTVGFYIWISLALQAVFRKTGEQGWKAWVPIYNTVILLQLGGQSPWWLLAALVPGGAIVLYVFVIIACHRINKGFTYGAGMTVLAALLLPVWASIVGWSSNRWVGAPRTGGRGPVRSGSMPPSDSASLGWLANSVPTGAPRPSQPAPPTVATPIVAPPMPPMPGAPVAAAPVAAAPAPVSAAPISSGPVSAAPISAAPVSAGPDSAAPVSDTSAAASPSDTAPEASPSAAAAPLSRLPIEISPTGYVPFDDEDDDDSAPMDGFAPAVPTPQPEPAPAPRRATAFSGEPAAASEDDEPSPWAPPAATRTPMRSPEPTGYFSDTSSEVSAVAGAPALGGPMSARSSVSAQRSAPEIPESEELFDETIVAPRKRTPWVLVPPLGAPIAITRDVLIIGRRPAADRDHPDAQLVPVADETRTMSKTHARLELRDGTWVITDLDSTNGVALIDVDGGEIEADPGRPLPVIERFLLGDAELRLVREGER